MLACLLFEYGSVHVVVIIVPCQSAGYGFSLREACLHGEMCFPFFIPSGLVGSRVVLSGYLVNAGLHGGGVGGYIAFTSAPRRYIK